MITVTNDREELLALNILDPNTYWNTEMYFDSFLGYRIVHRLINKERGNMVITTEELLQMMYMHAQDELGKIGNDIELFDALTATKLMSVLILKEIIINVN